MKNKKQIILSTLAVGFLVGGGYLFLDSNKIETSRAYDQAFHKPAKSDKQTIKKVDVPGDVVESFDSTKELNESAEVIAEVEIDESESFQYENVVFTLSNAKVKQVYKGHVDPENVIKILETGGYKDGTEYTFEGNEVFETGEKAYVYLEKYEGPVAEDAYVIKGVYQGKFIEEEGKLQSPNGVAEGLQIESESQLGLE
ncbi:hypothetical protein E8L90_13105 [Brevibacillus antibioticus]|uniref:Uncharacterized protein n=1 Tax=Brevibacillus antibioticus TaxID=2570228 RepID=A0A4V6X5V9_9BACL|nr:hypothetical protein [Brevibacillus antibioticus]TKI56333.1 hypothetical protein E8L90_13105 [Brevibacillus antibioticus]